MTKEEKEQLNKWMGGVMKLLTEVKDAMDAILQNEDKVWNKMKFLEERVKKLSEEKGRIYVPE